MKKIILFIACLFTLAASAQTTVPNCTTKVYLQRMPYVNTWFSTNGTDVFLHGNSICGVFGQEDLTITCNPPDVYVVNSSMHIEDYYEYALIDVCTGVQVGEAYKEEFQLTNGAEFPYHYNSNTNSVQIASGVDPAELTYLAQFGMPDTSIAYAVPHDCFPFVSCSTCVTRGRSDNYAKNQTLTNIPDGIYRYEETLTLPATVLDNGGYPKSYNDLIVRKQNGVVTVLGIESEIVMPTCCTQPSLPSTPTGLKIVQGNLLKWNASTNAETHNIYRALAFQGQGGWSVGNFQPVLIATNIAQTQFVIPPVSGSYFYFVSAVNCLGESQKSNGKRN